MFDSTTTVQANDYCTSKEGRTRLESLGYKITDIDNMVTVSWKNEGS
ncbi:hypothetical protein RyT2_28120 [Pseudolactococcus yaeyamensis]